MSKIQTGQSGEKLAVEFLKKQGFKIIEINFKCRFGEIDIVAQEKDTLVFVEVKTRSSNQFGLPEEAVGYRKIQHIIKSAQIYRSTHKNLPVGDRIDVVAIEKEGNAIKRLELIRNITG